MKRLALVCSFAALAGCASTSPAPAFEEVAKTIEARSGHKISWDAGTKDDPEVQRAVDRLLAQELTVDAAVQVALLVHPSMRATFEELTIAQAELVQAGLLKNPVFGIGTTAWEAEHISPNLFVTIEQEFLDVVTLPLKKRVAATELEAQKLAVGDRVLEISAHVREAFYAAQASAQILAMRRLVEHAAETSALLARQQHDAGNMNDLALHAELALAAEATIDRQRAEGAASVAREELNKAMGTWGSRTAWRLAQKLPDLPKEEVAIDKLESRAVADRLDIAAARRQVQALGYALSLAKTTRWTGTVNVSVEAGRLRHSGRLSFGPSVALEIPLFDQRQAQVAKLEAYTRRAESDLAALSVEVRADVRAGVARVKAARAIVEQYGGTVVPLREKVVKYSQEQYDAMLLGVYALIQAKASEYDAYAEYIEALHQYWVAESALERAVGGRLVRAN